MTREEALRALHEMVARGELDGRLVALLESRFDAVTRARAEAQAQAVREYGEFREALQGGGESG